jgi:hypothetical protein
VRHGKSVKKDGNTEVTERRTQRAQRKSKAGNGLEFTEEDATVKAAASRRSPRKATPRKGLRPKGLSYRGREGGDSAQREERVVDQKVRAAARWMASL